MDHRPVSWKLAHQHAENTQGLVVSGFASLPTGRALFLEFGWNEGSGSGWMTALAGIAPITDADGRDASAAALAFSYSGLEAMGLPPAALASFAAPYREGMLQEDRARRLGDRRNGEWLGTVVAGGPRWSANIAQREALPGVADDRAATLTATGHTEEQVTTALTVHALLLLYDADEDAAARRAAAVEAALAPHGVRVVRTLPLELRPDANGIAREHFGFADGVSQPLPYDEAGAVLVGTAPAPQDPWNGVPLGEFLLGHVNGHHERAPGPMVPADAAATAAGLPPHPQAEGFLDLGLDGSYMVVRELRQDVAAFWRSMNEGAARLAADGRAGVDATWLAERVVGRSTGGDLLCPGGYLTPDADGPANATGFFDRDRHGAGCPLGSHVRRANPRDGLAPRPEMKQTLLDAANHHRLLRRGRKFGPACDDPMNADNRERGLLFICLNTDIGRQFEFVQQTWLLNPNFATLYDETDPLVGPAGTMTVRDQPLRRIVPVETFVQMVGGDYFFLPSMKALRYLATL